MPKGALTQSKLPIGSRTSEEQESVSPIILSGAGEGRKKPVVFDGSDGAGRGSGLLLLEYASSPTPKAISHQI